MSTGDLFTVLLMKQYIYPHVLIQTGDIFQLFPASMVVDGRDFQFLNDLDIASDGMIYFTDSSRFNRREFPRDLLEGRAHGRYLH